MQINPYIEREPEKNPQTPMVYVEEKPIWEYKILTYNLRHGAPGEDDLNSLGEQGWELTGFFVYGNVLYSYFKRLK